MTRLVGQSTPSAHLQVTRNREERVDAPDGRAAVEGDLDGLEKQANRILVKPNKGKYQILDVEGQPARKQLCRRGPKGPGGHRVERTPATHPDSKESPRHRGLRYAER